MADEHHDDVTSNDDDDVTIIDLTGARDAREAFLEAADVRDTAERMRREAAADAEIARSDADRYAAQRMNEVHLLVDRARRSLMAAEQRSDVMLELAREEARRLVVAAREGRLEDDDLVELLATGAVAARNADATTATELDGLLARALRKALDLPLDEPYPRWRPGQIA